MKERGMLFAATMVKAILANTKTQTRRVLSIQPTEPPIAAQMSLNRSMTRPVFAAMWNTKTGDGSTCCLCPYGVVGDRLWVRETWGLFEERADKTVSALVRGVPPEGSGYKPHYRATDKLEMPSGAWRPSIHMFRWASRITLEITDVRVERLQDISEADALAEGIDDGWLVRNKVPPPRAARYRDLWEDINGAGSWDANPWVWVVSFKPIGTHASGKRVAEAAPT